MKYLTDDSIDRLIANDLIEADRNNKHEPSGCLSAGKLGWPLQWQILYVRHNLKTEFDDYTLRKFQRGKDVENWFVDKIKPVEKQKFLTYRNVVGYCDSIVDTKAWNNQVGIIPLEVKSVSNAKFKRIVSNGADESHILQNALYGIALESEYHAISYIASDDYRVKTFIYKVADSKKEIDSIISEFEQAYKENTIPKFIPRYGWQENIKYNNYPLFAGMNEEELLTEFNKLNK